MAKPLPYEPTAQPDETPEQALASLLATLHASGTLRTLQGLAGGSAGMAEVVADRLDTPGGRNLVGTLAAAATTLTELDADNVGVFLQGAERGLAAAKEEVKGDPPSLVGLGARLNDPDVRRGLAALIAFLKALGGHLHREVRVD